MPHVKWSRKSIETLQRARKQRKLTLDELAHSVGCTQAMLSMIETGRRVPGDKLTERLCEALSLRLIIPPARLVRVRRPTSGIRAAQEVDPLSRKRRQARTL